MTDRHKTEPRGTIWGKVRSLAYGLESWMNRFQHTIAALGFLVLGLYTMATLRTLLVLKDGNDMARQQLALTQRGLELSERPWVSMTDVRGGHLVRLKDGGALVEGTLTLKNVGNSIALYVHHGAKAVFSPYQPRSSTMPSVDLAKMESDECAELVRGRGRGISNVLFPHEERIVRWNHLLSGAELETALKGNRAPGSMEVLVLLCVEYQFSFSPAGLQDRQGEGWHRSMTALWIKKTGDDSGLRFELSTEPHEQEIDVERFVTGEFAD